jgi:aspartate carbamoyltransferase catalytic subunit
MSVSSLLKIDSDLHDLQFFADGRMRHLLSLRSFSAQQLTDILDRADNFIDAAGNATGRSNKLAGVTVANLFFEASTRTRISFELAARRVGAEVVNLDLQTSSRNKGETVMDTVHTLQAMDVGIFVVRDSETGTQTTIARNVNAGVSVLNAGESIVSHPTQGLLDLLTIRRHKGTFDQLTVAIVGDVAHSRVARSAAEGLSTLGVRELRLVSPPSLVPQHEFVPSAKIMTDVDEGIAGADVVMALRIQKERFENEDGIPDETAYFREYGITSDRLKNAAPGAIVMHPGPLNRGVEISSTVADGPSSVITNQVANGVAIRMAILEAVVS